MKFPVIAIDGKEMPRIPTSMKYGIKEIVNKSGRTLDDTYHKNTTSKKRTMTVEWKNLTDLEMKELLEQFSGRYISVEYFDAVDGEVETRNFVVTSNASMPVTYFTDKGKLFSSLSFDLEER